MLNRQKLKQGKNYKDYLNIFDKTLLINQNNLPSIINYPKILVIGFFDRGNLGDEAFKSCFDKICPMTYVCVDDINSIPNDVEVIICGGGDIINPYFMEKIQTITSSFIGPIYGFSIGIPFIANIKYLDIFDHVIIRANQDLSIVSGRIHEDNVTFMPDFTVLLKTNAIKRPFTGRPRIGFFLAQPMINGNQVLIQKIADIINTVYTFADVYLMSFNTGVHPNENDNVLNDQIMNLCTVKVINVKDTYLKRPEAMLKFMTTFDFNFCMRYHSVMFSLIQNIPFVAMYTTRKIDNQLKDVGMSEYGYSLPVDDNYKPTDIDTDKVIDLIKFGLANPNKCKEYEFPNIDIDKITNLLVTKKRKKIVAIRKYDKTILEVFDEIKGYIMNYFQFDSQTYDNIFKNTDTLANYIEGSKNYDAITTARLICYGITDVINTPYIWGLAENMMELPTFSLKEAIKYIYNDYANYLSHIQNSSSLYPTININKRVIIDMQYMKQDDFKGHHRSGWSYVLGGLYQLDKKVLNKDAQDAILVDTYIDRTFHWAKNILKLVGILPYSKPWVGIIHHTFNTTYSSYNCDQLFLNDLFLESLIYCKCLIVFSNHIADTLSTYLSKYGYTNVEVRVLRHPTEIPEPEQMFNINKFLNNSNKKIVQIGGWLRNSYAIYDLPVSLTWNNKLNIKKSVLKGLEMTNYFKPNGLFEYLTDVLNQSDIILEENILEGSICEGSICEGSICEGSIYGMPTNNICEGSICEGSISEQKVDNVIVYKNSNKYISGMLESLLLKDDSVEILDTLSNADYDDLLVSNIVFLNLIDCSAVNTVIECIARNTPLIVNRHPALVEILGSDYPGFYDSLSEAAYYCTNLDYISKMAKYLIEMDKSNLQLDYFLESFQCIIEQL